MYIHTYIRTYVHTYACNSICMYIHAYIHPCSRIYVCMYICICMYIDLYDIDTETLSKPQKVMGYIHTYTHVCSLFEEKTIMENPSSRARMPFYICTYVCMYTALLAPRNENRSDYVGCYGQDAGASECQSGRTYQCGFRDARQKLNPGGTVRECSGRPVPTAGQEKGQASS